MSDKTYTPIPCQLYDQLEIMSMHKTDCKITYTAEGHTKKIEGKIVDLFPISSVEYLKLDSGKTLRLDLLLSINEIEFKEGKDCSV